MNFRILAAALGIALLAAPAAAENWRASSAGMGAIAYIDVDSIQRSGEQVTFWREVRWPEVKTFEDGTSYDRIAALYEADCNAMTLRSLHLRVSLGGEVIGSVEDTGEVEQATPGSTAETDLRSACFGEWPQG